MRGVMLVEAVLSRTNLRKANLGPLPLTDERGRDSGKMWPANLSRADFHKANLTDVCLMAANVKGANFTGANMTRADLRECDIKHARTNGTVMAGATLKS